MSIISQLVKTAMLVGYELVKGQALQTVEKEKHDFRQMLVDQGARFVTLIFIKDLMNLFVFTGLFGVVLFVTGQSILNTTLQEKAVLLIVAGFGLYFVFAIGIYMTIRSVVHKSK